MIPESPFYSRPKELKKILIIEDDLDDQLLARMAAVQSNFSLAVHTVGDILEGLQLLAALSLKNKELPNLVLLSLDLAGDPLRFLQLQQKEKYGAICNLPVIVSAASYSPVIFNALKNFPTVIGSLVKPVLFENLEPVLEKKFKRVPQLQS